MTSPAYRAAKDADDGGTTLKPCPFCGAEAELTHDSDHHGEWFNLGCSQHWHRLDPDKACPAGLLWYTADTDAEAAAIAAWNRRATKEAEPRFIAPPGSKATTSPAKRRFDNAGKALRECVGVLGVDDEFDAAVREYKIARYEWSKDLVSKYAVPARADKADV